MPPIFRSRVSKARGATRARKAVPPPEPVETKTVQVDTSAGDVLLRMSEQTPPPERLEARALPPTKTVGGPGYSVWGGYIASRERDPELQGPKRYEIYGKQLANSELIATGVSFFLELLAKAEWTWEPADDSPQAKEISDFVNEVVGEMHTPLPKLVKRGGLMHFYGFSIHEWTAMLRGDGKIGILDVAVRPQLTINRWDIDEFGTVHGVWQQLQSSFKEVYLPRAKLLHFVDDSLSDSPEGFGVLRSLVPAVKRLQRYEQLEGIGFEIDLRGIPLLRIPIEELNRKLRSGEIDQKEYDAAIAPFMAFAEGHIKAKDLALILDSSVYENPDQTLSQVQKYAAELIQGGATSTESIGKAIDRVQLAIARRLNITHMMLGGTGGGAFALSEDQSINFGLTVDGCLKDMANTIDRDLVLPLVQLNGWPRELAPKAKTSKSQWRTIQELAAFVRDLAVAGVMIDPEDESIMALFDIAGLPRPTKFAKPDPMDAGLFGGGKPGGGKPGDPTDPNAQPEGEGAGRKPNPFRKVLRP